MKKKNKKVIIKKPGTIIEEKHGCVSGYTRISFDLSVEESDELRQALKTVDRYRTSALKIENTSEEDADWTMYQYEVKTDKVIVTVEQGMCG